MHRYLYCLSSRFNAGGVNEGQGQACVEAGLWAPAMMREVAAMQLFVLPGWACMSRSSAATGGHDSTNVLMCQVLDAAGEVAGLHQDVSRTEVFATAGKGRAADVSGRRVAELGERAVEVPGKGPGPSVSCHFRGRCHLCLRGG